MCVLLFFPHGFEGDCFGFWSLPIFLFLHIAPLVKHLEGLLGLGYFISKEENALKSSKQSLNMTQTLLTGTSNLFNHSPCSVTTQTKLFHKLSSVLCTHVL